ncbi:MAG: 16S rRNA (guanine(966)-N(2))-methyltransferase RsmD [Coriobacteriia bacterium]|nr:16S rRNA (guanine(966)-N(2))-methyltransferase RsmD [Coriobacteriia bacterium]
MKAPAGSDTRPTTDRVREAMFSTVFSLAGDLCDTGVLDLYAGSGALGIEALSRGAAHVTFVERNRRAATVIESNLSSLGAASHRWCLVRSDVSRLLTVGDVGPVSLLFADPPYTIDAAVEWQVLEGVARAGMLEVDCLVVYEHRADHGGTPPECFAVRARKRYGDTGVTYATYEG